MEKSNIDYPYQISVGMPVWGVEKYIRRCLESILNQDFSDMEVLVIDDCGPDKSIEIAKMIKEKHPKGNKIRILHQPKNMGCWAARNRILEEAKGKYILLIDSDDYLENGAISALYQLAEETGVEAIYGSVNVVDENGKTIQNSGVDGISLPALTLRGKDKLASYANDNIHKLKLHNFIWNILLRSDFIAKHNLRFRQTKFWDDVLFNADMQPLVESAAFIPKVTYHYVIRDNSLSNFQARSVIKIEEVRQHILNQKYLIQQSTTLKGKTYYETRVTKVMLAMCYTLIGALKNKDKISAKIANHEYRDAIHHPLSLYTILRFRQYRAINIALWLIGYLPPYLSVEALIFIAKAKKLL